MLFPFEQHMEEGTFMDFLWIDRKELKNYKFTWLCHHLDSVVMHLIKTDLSGALFGLPLPIHSISTQHHEDDAATLER